MTVDGRFLIAAVPMRDHVELTERLVQSILAGGETDRVIVFDNDSRSQAARTTWLRQSERVSWRQRSGNGIIYQLWNEAWRDALGLWRSTGQLVDLAILNNDIVLPPDAMGLMSRALRAAPADIWAVYPDYRLPLGESTCAEPPELERTWGTYNLGGLSGFAFMLRPELHDEAGWPFIDERFEWLCGDGDLVQEMQRLGGQAGRVLGLPCQHSPRTTSTDGRNTWTFGASQRDKVRRTAKWG